MFLIAEGEKQMDCAQKEKSKSGNWVPDMNRYIPPD